MSKTIYSYIHHKTGEEFLHEEYGNFGEGYVPVGKKDLPNDGYPYLVKFRKEKIPAWLSNSDPLWIRRLYDPN